MANETVKVTDCIPKTYVKDSDANWWIEDRPEHLVFCAPKDTYSPKNYGLVYVARKALDKITGYYCLTEQPADGYIALDEIGVADTYEEDRGEEKCLHVLISWGSVTCGAKRFECTPETTKSTPVKPKSN